jgi:hypothetical protein
VGKFGVWSNSSTEKAKSYTSAGNVGIYIKTGVGQRSVKPGVENTKAATWRLFSMENLVRNSELRGGVA